MERVAPERLAAWAVACLEKVGVPPPEARLVGESLVQTSVWGVDSHGVLRLTHYLRRMTIGSIKPAAAPVVMRTGPVTAQVHGEDGLGIVHAALAMETAIEMAKENGLGAVGVGHSSHCGGFMPSATPGGVPVVMMSPGSSVMNWLTYETRVATG